jgi:hypothetical protein
MSIQQKINKPKQSLIGMLYIGDTYARLPAGIKEGFDLSNGW